MIEEILKYSARETALFTTNVLPKTVAVKDPIALNQIYSFLQLVNLLDQ